jgi:hypothetical protein
MKAPKATGLRRKYPGRLALVAGVVLVLLGAARAPAQMVDLNGNGMSDIWEWVYSATNIDPNADPDGDGFSNLQEATAGTNPFDSNSYPHIPIMVYSPTNFSVTLSSALGKLYQLQSTTNFGGANWVVETNQKARTGTNVTLTVPTTSVMKFYRVGIADVNSDGSGLMNDWEKYKLGLDPNNPFSNGTLDGNGNQMTDFQYVVGRLASQNVITIAATDPVTTEPDPGSPASDYGTFTVTRGGFPLNLATVHLQLGGPGTGFGVSLQDYLPLSTTVSFPAGTSTKTITVVPMANTNLQAPVIVQLKLLPGANYSVGTQSNASVVIYPSPTAKGTGLTGQYFTNSSATYSSANNFNPANLITNRIDPVIDFVWGNNTNPIPNSGGYYCVRWTGQVEPQYSETYYFDANTDDGVKLWVNDQLIIDDWKSQGATDSIGSIALQGGVRYDIKMEYFQLTGSAVAHLYWNSTDQSKQIIPSSRLFPTNTPPAPTAITSPLSAIAFLGQPFSFTVTAANSPLGYTASGLPPGLNFNAVSGAIVGTPTVAGDYQTALTASNAVGLSAAIVDIQVIANSNSVVQEIWTGVPGTNIADIPVSTPATVTNVIGGLDVTGISGTYGVNYGERIRGYITAPTTGNYYFWIAGSDSAELWIANDSEPVNKVRRAFVSPTNSTGPHQWTLQPSQRSGWLTLTAGQKYYLEILHKAGNNSNDNWSVGWLQDPFGTNTTPGGVVTNYVLSRYYPLPPSVAPGTLYAAELTTAPGVTNMGVGTATLRLSADNSRAVLNFSFSGVPSVVIGEHINNDAYGSYPSEILFDISAALPQPDGSYVWPIGAVGSFQASDVLSIFSSGKAYLTILTGDYPNGELIGHFKVVQGTQTFTPPPAPPAWTDDSATANGAARFLTQASFGPSPGDIAYVQANGYSAWITNQFALPATHHLPLLLANGNIDPAFPYLGNYVFNTWWQKSVTAPDQLRQRVAFALSEIMVVSDVGALQDNGQALCSYYDTLLDNAFGNYRSLLEAVTLTPAMGMYLNMQGNGPGSIVNGTHANENYAREINQLFSIGLNRMWPDGTLVLNSQGSLVPTYNQNVISGFASTFTGWNFYQTNQASGLLPTSFYPSANYTNPMVLVPKYHEIGTKLLLDNIMLPAAWGNQTVTSTSTNDAYCSQDLELALNSIFNNQNVGPLICRQLIQRLVTSNPSSNYLFRVTQVFNNDGTGVRGNLQAVISAILLDYEARSTDLLTQTNYGKQREPLLRVTAAARALPPGATPAGTYNENGGTTIYITNSAPHRLGTGDIIWLNFTDASGQPAPSSQAYSVTVQSPTNFTVNAPGFLSGTHLQTNGAITVSISGHGLAMNNSAYLTFTTGGATNGVVLVTNVPDGNHFIVATLDTTNRAGSCLLSRWTGGGFTQSKTNVTIYAPFQHGLSPGNNVFINFTQSGNPASGLYPVNTVIDATHFTIIVTNSVNGTTASDQQVIYPLIPPPLVRNGTVTFSWNNWVMNATDTGSSSSLAQTPLNSPTVFNFFFPSYAFPGPLSDAGLTTPEFQLTSDTTVAWQMNFMEGALLGNSNNTNGPSSFINGGGAITMDVGPYMTTAFTSNAGIPGLVDALNSLLCVGQLSPASKTFIVNFVANNTNFPYTTPTPGQMRDRVRAVVHLILTSPDYIIQK